MNKLPQSPSDLPRQPDTPDGQNEAGPQSPEKQAAQLRESIRRFLPKNVKEQGKVYAQVFADIQTAQPQLLKDLDITSPQGLRAFVQQETQERQENITKLVEGILPLVYEMGSHSGGRYEIWWSAVLHRITKDSKKNSYSQYAPLLQKLGIQNAQDLERIVATERKSINDETDVLIKKFGVFNDGLSAKELKKLDPPVAVLENFFFRLATNLNACKRIFGDYLEIIATLPAAQKILSMAIDDGVYMSLEALKAMEPLSRLSYGVTLLAQAASKLKPLTVRSYVKRIKTVLPKSEDHNQVLNAVSWQSTDYIVSLLNADLHTPRPINTDPGLKDLQKLSKVDYSWIDWSSFGLQLKHVSEITPKHTQVWAMIARNLYIEGGDLTKKTNVQRAAERIAKQRKAIRSIPFFKGRNVVVGAHGEVNRPEKLRTSKPNPDWERYKELRKFADKIESLEKQEKEGKVTKEYVDRYRYRFAKPALMEKIQSIQGEGVGLALSRPVGDGKLKGEEWVKEVGKAKRDFLKNVQTTSSPCTMLFEGHGGPKGLYFSEGEVVGDGFKDTMEKEMKISPAELADALLARSKNLKVPLPIMMGTSEYNQYSYSHLVGTYGNRLYEQGMQLDKNANPTLGTVMDTELPKDRKIGDLLSNPVIYVPNDGKITAKRDVFIFSACLSADFVRKVVSILQKKGAIKKPYIQVSKDTKSQGGRKKAV